MPCRPHTSQCIFYQARFAPWKWHYWARTMVHLRSPLDSLLFLCHIEKLWRRASLLVRRSIYLLISIGTKHTHKHTHWPLVDQAEYKSCPSAKYRLSNGHNGRTRFSRCPNLQLFGPTRTLHDDHDGTKGMRCHSCTLASLVYNTLLQHQLASIASSSEKRNSTIGNSAVGKRSVHWSRR
jgi:hypothetical protein